MSASAPDAGGIGRGEDAALADSDHVFREKRNQTLAEGEVGFKDRQIAVVHADDFRAVRNRASDFGLRMNLEKRVESGGTRGAGQRPDFIVGQRAHDDQDGAGAGFAGLQHLDRMNEKIFPNARPCGGVRPKMSGHAAQVGEISTEKFLVGQHGERVNARGLVTLRLFERGHAGFDVARGRGAAFDFGDDRQRVIGTAERLGERGRARQRRVKCDQLGFGHGANERSDFAPFMRHDLGELVGHESTTKHTKPTKTRPELPRIFVCFVGFVVSPLSMSAIDDLRLTMARLRGPGGCPWDQEQTHSSLVRCLIDEVSELIDTIDRGDMPHMREELGDVLIQVVFHACLAEEAGHFNFDDVAREINEKLIRRHPHVFGTGKLDTSDQVIAQWELIKAGEKKNGPVAKSSAVFKELPPRLPALMFAEAVWKQIEKKGLPVAGIVDTGQVVAMGQRLDEASLGKMLFELTAAARAKGLDPEGALRLHATHVMREVEAKAAVVPTARES